MRRIVIVGGGIAGVSTASALRAGGFDGDLTLVDSGDVPYDRPPLSKDYLAGARDAEQLALRPEHWYADQRIRLVNRTAVTALRPGEGAVELSDTTLLPADRVVLATGGGAARPPIAGTGSDRVHVLRTMDDADRLRPFLAPGSALLVVGAGLIGAEVASTAVHLGCRVVLVDPAAAPLAAALGEDLADWLHGLHARHRVRALRTTLESLTERAQHIEVRLAGEAAPRLFDAVVLGVGMVPCIELAVAAGLEVDRGIVVDTRQVTSNPAVLAVGDPARIRRGRRLLPRTEHWEAAVHGGERAAAGLLGLAAPAPTAPWFWTDRHGRHVEAVGHMDAAERVVVRGCFDHPSFSVFGLRDDRVVAAAAVDDSLTVRAARRLIDRRIPVGPVQLADPQFNLRALLRG